MRLEVPKDGSVPRIAEWQLRRKVSPAIADEHYPDHLTPRLTESGLTLPGADPAPAARTGNPVDLTAPSAWDDTYYTVERIHHAEYVPELKDYKVWIKWVGSDQLTYQLWRANWKATCKDMGVDVNARGNNLV